jgi:hypothetical protein
VPRTIGILRVLASCSEVKKRIGKPFRFLSLMLPLQVFILADTSYNATAVDEVAALHADADCVVRHWSGLLFARLQPDPRHTLLQGIVPAVCMPKEACSLPRRLFSTYGSLRGAFGPWTGSPVWQLKGKDGPSVSWSLPGCCRCTTAGPR